VQQFPVGILFPPSVNPDCWSLLPLFSFDASVLITHPSKQSSSFCLNGVGGHGQNRYLAGFSRGLFVVALPSGVTSKPANGGHFKTGQRKVAWD
jgi:hypothetical protein